PPESINRFKKIDGRSIQNARLLHRFFEIRRRGKVLSLLRVLSIEDDNDLTLVTVGGMIDPWIGEARRSLHFGMPIEDRTPLPVIPYFVTDNHHSHGALPLFPTRADSIVNCRSWNMLREWPSGTSAALRIVIILVAGFSIWEFSGGFWLAWETLAEPIEAQWFNVVIESSHPPGCRIASGQTQAL